jgi:outer membrane protein insertion porin family
VRVTGADDVEPPLPQLLQTRLDGPLRDAALDEDVRSLRRALHERGHVEGTVEAEVKDGGGLLPVTLRVRPGPRTLVAAVQVEAPPEPDVAAPGLRLIVGQPYRVADVAADVAALQSAWRDAGFLQAEVTPVSELSDDKTEARVTLRVVPGGRTRVDRIVVAGLEHTREEVVRRELRLEEGQPLGLQRVLESQRRLGALGLFRRASVRELDPSSLGSRSLLVALEEAPRTTVAYGVGYAERERLRGSLEVTRRNLFGLDRSLTVFGRGSLRGSRALVSFREPYLLGRRQELFVTGFREGEDRVSFDFTRLGGLVQTARALGTHTSLILRVQYQRTKLFNVDVPLSDVDRQFQSSTTSGPSASLIHDTRDDPLDPRRGVFLGADTQLSQRFLGGDRFFKGFAQAAGYRRLTGSLLLALHARLGLARTFGAESPSRLPLADRFFAGGDYSLRGFSTDSAGPSELSEDGTRRVPTGGNALLLGGVELRFDATRFVALAVFADAGNVFPLVSDLGLRDLREALGVGLRYKSALGPLRVDWGYKLDRRPGESASHLHITVGHAF